MILADKARRFATDPEIASERLLAEHHDLERLAAREYHNDRLDQLAIALILGVR